MLYGRILLGSVALVMVVGCGAPEGTETPDAPELFSAQTVQGLGGSNCTHDKVHYGLYHRYATLPERKIDWPVCDGEPSEDHPLCGRSALAIESDFFADDPWSRLAREWIAARLNYLNGAQFPPPPFDQKFDHAIQLVLGCSISAADQPTALFLADYLKDFNLGVTGPGACP